MYVIKFDEDKNLRQTKKQNLYQYENGASTLIFLLPQIFEEVNIADCSVRMRYILPNNAGNVEELQLQENLYNDWLEYHYPIQSRFTSFDGDIELWLSIINTDKNIIIKSNSTFVSIHKNKEITDYFTQEQYDQLDRIEQTVSNLANDNTLQDEQIIQLGEQLSNIQSVLVDGISYDESTGIIRLLSGGETVGEPIEINSNSGIYEYDTYDNFPATGKINCLYIDKLNNCIYCWNNVDNNYYLVGTNIYNLTAISGGDSNG